MKINKIPKLKSNEGILISYDMPRPIEEVINVHKGISSAYPEHPVICIPNNYNIKVQDIDTMIKYLEDCKEKINYENRN